MKKLSITDAQPGQVVARPVATPSGMVMIQPGCQLTTETIGRLANLGIDSVWVDGVAESAKPLDVQTADLDRRFTGHENDSLMMALKAIVLGCMSQGSVDARD